jgi:hypothetical protein
MGLPLDRRLARGAAGGAGVLLVLALFLVALAAKERDNRFCVSCHLHEEKFDRLVAPAARDLAAFHHARDVTVGCIACHGGAGPGMRLAVWGVAGLDTLRFLVGAYGEPTHMRLPLRDAECRQCHTPILRAARTQAPAPSAPGAVAHPGEASPFGAEAETEGRGGSSYHAIREHDTVRVACVRCHTSHTTDSDVGNRFISRPTVVPICRDCHTEM